MSQRPAAIGMLVCEQVIIEEATRNTTPVNCFSRRVVQAFPSEAASFVVYAILNDGVGKIRMDLTIKRLDNLDEIFKRSDSVALANPLQEVRCLYRIQDLSFPVSGRYELTLLADDEIIAQRTIRVTQKETAS